MEKIYSISILLSFLGLWVTSIVPSEYEVILGFILIFSFGILHGSNDILLIKNMPEANTKYSFFKVLTVYLLTVLIAVIIFYFIPSLALILFIFFSSFHFGEQHWEGRLPNTNKTIIALYYFFYGLFILMLLFVFNTKQVVEVIASISNYTLNNLIITYSFFVVLFILISLSVILSFKLKGHKKTLLTELFYILVFTIVFKVSTLIWGFAIYFILWHSIPSLFEQINFIYGGFKKQNILSYVKNAFPYWLISLIGLTIVFMLFKDEKLLYAIVFSFIAAVTFPHALVINKMFKYKKTQSN